MTNVLRILALVLVSGCLVLAGGWFVADRYATDLLRSELSDYGLTGIITARSANLPRPDRLRLRDVQLIDPTTGEAVAQCDEVDVHFAWPVLDGDSSAPLLRIEARGGRVMITSDGETLGITRAIEALIEHVQAVLGPSDEDSGPPTLPLVDVRGVRVILQQPGLELETIENCSVELHPWQNGALVQVELGERGRVDLRFDDSGLRGLSVAGATVSPACALFLPGRAADFVADLRPRGRIDLELTRDEQGLVRAEGTLHEAILSPAHLPFELERVTLPFRLDDGHFSLSDARIGFPGGELSTSLEHSAAGLSLQLDVVDAEFRAADLLLIPQQQLLTWLQAEDGGNLELHLVIESGAEGERPVVRGWGGVLLNRVELGPTRLPVEDLVGSFDLREDRIVFREISGVCASGVARASGTLDLRSGDYELSASVFDMDLGLLRRQLAAAGAEEAGVTGWLQGSVQCDGRLGQPELSYAEGQLSVRAGNLWKVPVLDAVIRALGLGGSEQTERHRLELRFREQAGSWNLDELRLESALLSLVGGGRVRADRQLDIDLIPFASPDGNVGRLMDYVQRQFVKIEVRGTLAEPQVRVLPIKIVSGPILSALDWIGELFSSDEPPSPDSP
ncbi:MAG: hypothetical protein ACT4PU_01020 [Planctomycetota bacterium]